MSREVIVSWSWEGKEVEVKAVMDPPEFDVGIINPYAAGLTVLDQSGKVLELTEDEYEDLFRDDDLCSKLIEAYWEQVE